MDQQLPTETDPTKTRITLKKKKSKKIKNKLISSVKRTMLKSESKKKQKVKYLRSKNDCAFFQEECQMTSKIETFGQPCSWGHI